MNSDTTVKGVRVVRNANGATVANNRRCRIVVQVDGLEDTIVAASGPRNWHPSVSFACNPDAAITICRDAEGPQGPMPDKTGAFEFSDPSSNIVFPGE